jgi:competence protein ComEA
MDFRLSALSRRQLFGGAVALAVVVVLVLRYFGGGGAGSTAAPSFAPLPARAAKPAAAKLVVVDVAGDVRRPGLHAVPAGSRVEDAIVAAGGATRKAQLDAVNLAAPVADGEQIVVPGSGAGGVAAASSPAGSSPSAPLDLNSATLEQLEALPGIGPVTAQKILDYRQRHGAFHAVSELEGVPGIGPAHLAQLKGLVIP